jgi:hypothetical protein
MLTPRHRPNWQTPTGYAATHCKNCEAGWTRTGKEGGELTVCLLDREPVLADMTSCDKYEPRAAKPA